MTNSIILSIHLWDSNIHLKKSFLNLDQKRTSNYAINSIYKAISSLRAMRSMLTTEYL